MKGFSRANLMYMRAFAEAWPSAEIVQQAVGQMPWGHNLVLLTKLKDPQLYLTYAQRAVEHGWSRAPLTVIDYIVVHELCHLHHRDHSDAFWNKVDKVLPDYRDRKEWLRIRGAELDL